MHSCDVLAHCLFPPVRHTLVVLIYLTPNWRCHLTDNKKLQAAAFPHLTQVPWLAEYQDSPPLPTGTTNRVENIVSSPLLGTNFAILVAPPNSEGRAGKKGTASSCLQRPPRHVFQHMAVSHLHSHLNSSGVLCNYPDNHSPGPGKKKFRLRATSTGTCKEGVG